MSDDTLMVQILGELTGRQDDVSLLAAATAAAKEVPSPVQAPSANDNLSTILSAYMIAGERSRQESIAAEAQRSWGMVGWIVAGTLLGALLGALLASKR